MLLPGSYRLNPYAYKWDEVNAVEIGPDQVGVRILKVGKDPRDLAVDPSALRFVVPDGYRGVQATVVRNGTYYLNPYLESIRRWKSAATAPNCPTSSFLRDGFNLKPHVMVEYQVLRDKVRSACSPHRRRPVAPARQHPQQQNQNEILQRSFCRTFAAMPASKAAFRRRDFIITTSRSWK